MPIVDEQSELIAMALALGAKDVAGWSDADKDLLLKLPPADSLSIANLRHAIQAGKDPLGDLFCQLRSPDQRRPIGAFYTPWPLVRAMLGWAAAQATPARILDPGCGSGRFLVEAARRFPAAELIGVEIDPVAACLARAHLAAAGFAERSAIITCDFRTFSLPPIDGVTLVAGNPPYVRHHAIDSKWKKWLSRTAKERGLPASQLAGLHLYFLLHILDLLQPGDVGILVTAAEWLDVNYGSLARSLLAGPLGVQTIQLIEPHLEPFPGTATTGVIVGFQVGAPEESVHVQSVSQLAELHAAEYGQVVARQNLASVHRWTTLVRARPERRADHVELGELCRVHRGQATGANSVWISNGHAPDLPESVLFPTVTRARELLEAGAALTTATRLKRVIDLPADLELLSLDDQERIGRFLAYAVAQGAADSYIAQHRTPWWSVGLREPAPILATYMARRPPVFVRNLAQARHVNIAHGLYPRQPLSEAVIRALIRYLSHNVSVHSGRTYAGGLTKFEPREMERLLVPEPDVLVQQTTIEEAIS